MAIDFDHLDFFDSRFVGIDLVGEDELRICVRNILVVESPLQPVTAVVDECELVFERVTRSVRCMHPYRSNGEDGFLPVVEVEDFPARVGSERTRTFELEGLLLSPRAWIEDWWIEAECWRIVESPAR